MSLCRFVGGISSLDLTVGRCGRFERNERNQKRRPPCLVSPVFSVSFFLVPSFFRSLLRRKMSRSGAVHLENLLHSSNTISQDPLQTVHADVGFRPWLLPDVTLVNCSVSFRVCVCDQSSWELLYLGRSLRYFMEFHDGRSRRESN